MSSEKLPTPKSQNPINSQLPNLGHKPSTKPFDIRERTFQFAVRILEITAALPETSEGRVVKHQLARAGTSVGANVEEADGAISKADKRKSLIVARKEVRECRYWLRIVACRWKAIDVASDISESSEILNILSAILLKLG